MPVKTRSLRLANNISFSVPPPTYWLQDCPRLYAEIGIKRGLPRLDWLAVFTDLPRIVQHPTVFPFAVFYDEGKTQDEGNTEETLLLYGNLWMPVVLASPWTLLDHSFDHWILDGNHRLCWCHQQGIPCPTLVVRTHEYISTQP